MRALVLYDNTGKVYLIMYGEENAPVGIPSMFVDIPDGACLERIDVTDAANPQPVFSYLPDSDIGKMQKQIAVLESDVEDLKASNEELKSCNEELTLALADMMVGGSEDDTDGECKESA